MLTYNEIDPIVEDLVRIKSKKYAKGFLSQDDISQEIRIKCYTSMTSYNESKGQSVKTFLNVCTENHLKNLMRDKFAKFNPPCKNKGCSHYTATGSPTDKSKECPSFMKYYQKYVRKCAVRMPVYMDDFWCDNNESAHRNEEAFEWTDINISLMDIFTREYPNDCQRLFSCYQSLLNGDEISEIDKDIIKKVAARVLEI
jgi:hypothetical protein